MNFYNLEPERQRRIAFRRLTRYLRNYIQPYHPYLRKLYRERGVDVASIRTEEDFRRLPILDKHDLRADAQAFILRPDNPESPLPEGYDTEPLRRSTLLKYLLQDLVNIPRDYSRLVRQPTLRERIRRRALLEWMPVHFHASTGSTGASTPATYTHHDLTKVIPAIGSLLILPKSRSDRDVYFDWADRTLNIFPGAPHLAFFVPVLAKTAVGTSSFDTFGGHIVPTDRQIQLFVQGGFTSISAVPSYFVHWLRRALELQEAEQVGPLNGLNRVMLGGEPVSESLRAHIRRLALQAGAHPKFRIYQTFGMTEIKWGFLECHETSGIHLNPRYFYWELLDPETREPVPEGAPGVLTFTHIDWRGTVLVRYWTGDLVKGGMRWTRCHHCGYTFPKIYPPICRAEKDFTKIKGARVDLTSLIESVRSTSGVRDFQIVLDNESQEDEFSRDHVTVHILCDEDVSPDARGGVEASLRERVKAHTEISPDAVIFEDDAETFAKRLFEKNGIKAEYLVERRKLHI